MSMVCFGYDILCVCVCGVCVRACMCACVHAWTCVFVISKTHTTDVVSLRPVIVEREIDRERSRP